MRSRLILFTLSLYLAFAILGCTSKPATDSSNDPNATDNQNATANGEKESGAKERKEHKEARREHVAVPAGTAITVSLGAAIGSKLSQAGETFTGSVAKNVLVGNT